MNHVIFHVIGWVFPGIPVMAMKGTCIQDRKVSPKCSVLRRDGLQSLLAILAFLFLCVVALHPVGTVSTEILSYLLDPVPMRPVPTYSPTYLGNIVPLKEAQRLN